MPFVVIKGVYRPGVGIPDGDSVRFAADDPSLWNRLEGRLVRPGTNNTVQLRFEGIDAIEKNAIRPLSTGARDSMLDLIGAPTINAAPVGYVLSRSSDAHGRPIVFAFAGEAAEEDGASIFLDADRLEESVNYQQVRNGFAYPLYYNTLFRALRTKLNQALDEARAANRGYWPTDATMAGVDVVAQSQLSQIPPIWPKLWRRLEEYLRDNHDLADFLAFIRASGERADDLTTLEQHSLDNYIDVNGDNVRMTVDPRNLRVVSDLT
ncbi:MAG TPA: hypothetical protein VER03_22040 [Bryobacteraceae bacterium]|nr:hypothetical protein [Bryobacteraceae bacterium]